MSDAERLSRRAWLRGEFLGKGARQLEHMLEPANAKQDEPGLPQLTPPASESPRYRKTFPILRPPGAVEEEHFLNECTRCNACREACPPQAIVRASRRFRRAAETPTIDPIRQPCLMCEDFPCIAVCEPGVLLSSVPVRMGTVRIDVSSCTAYQGSSCTSCVDHCPVPGALTVVKGRPHVVEEACTGCGVCQHVCPAPQNAILLLPVAERPRPESSPGPMETLDSGVRSTMDSPAGSNMMQDFTDSGAS